MKRFWIRLGVIPYVILGVIFAGIGLMASNHIVTNWYPFDVARLDLMRDTALDRVDAAALLEAANIEIVLAFLACVLVTITGITLPLAYVLNKRIGQITNASFGQIQPHFLVTLRQAMWVGLWAAFCLWLQMNRSLGFAVAALVAIVLLLLEILLQVRTHAASMAPQQPRDSLAS